MRMFAIAAAGLLLAGPALAQTASGMAGAPPSPYGAPSAAAGQTGLAPQVSANANTFGTAAASVSGGSALGGVLQTFDNIGAVRTEASTPAAGAAPKPGDLIGAQTSAMTAAKSAKPAAKPR